MGERDSERCLTARTVVRVADIPLGRLGLQENIRKNANSRNQVTHGERKSNSCPCGNIIMQQRIPECRDARWRPWQFLGMRSSARKARVRRKTCTSKNWRRMTWCTSRAVHVRSFGVLQLSAGNDQDCRVQFLRNYSCWPRRSSVSDIGKTIATCRPPTERPQQQLMVPPLIVCTKWLEIPTTKLVRLMNSSSCSRVFTSWLTARA